MTMQNKQNLAKLARVQASYVAFLGSLTLAITKTMLGAMMAAVIAAMAAATALSGCLDVMPPVPTCGDGELDPNTGEDCDLGDMEPDPDCDIDCTVPECGDGVTNLAALNTGTPDIAGDLEECDTAGNSESCDADCTMPECGDGLANPLALNTGTPDIADDLEECDTAGNSDSCDADCTMPGCGDGFANPLALNTGTPDIASDTEECDTAGDSQSCDADCTAAACGDGYLNAAAEEQCDDGNTEPGDGCSDTCQIEETGICTDGPSRRVYNALAYDGVRGRTVLFGGYDGLFKDDTWEWDDSSWQRILICP